MAPGRTGLRPSQVEGAEAPWGGIDIEDRCGRGTVGIWRIWKQALVWLLLPGMLLNPGWPHRAGCGWWGLDKQMGSGLVVKFLIWGLIFLLKAM